MGLRSLLTWIGGPWRRRAPGWWYAHPRIRPSHHDPRARAHARAHRGAKKANYLDPLKHVFDAWGFDRCLWGTDWTRAFAVVNYEQATEPFLKTDHLSDSERAMLMGGACAKAYGWSPKKA